MNSSFKMNCCCRRITTNRINVFNDPIFKTQRIMTDEKCTFCEANNWATHGDRKNKQ